MPNTMPHSLSEIMHDETLTPGERVHLIEAFFVHDAPGQEPALLDAPSPLDVPLRQAGSLASAGIRQPARNRRAPLSA